MGARQTAQPLGVALAAAGLPALAHAHGAHHALLFPAALCAAATVAVVLLVVDPPRPDPAAARRRRVAVPRVPDAAPRPSGELAARRPAVRRRGVHARLPRRGAALGPGRGRPADLRVPDRRRGWTGAGRGLVRPGGEPAAADASARRGQRGADARHRGRRGDRAVVRDPRLRAGRGHHRRRQRAGVHRRRRARRLGVVRAGRSARRTPSRTWPRWRPRRCWPR